jgi:hypothetical protein
MFKGFLRQGLTIGNAVGVQLPSNPALHTILQLGMVDIFCPTEILPRRNRRWHTVQWFVRAASFLASSFADAFNAPLPVVRPERTTEATKNPLLSRTITVAAAPPRELSCATTML